VLAGLGYEEFQRRLSRRARPVMFATALLAITLECASAPMNLRTVPVDVPPVYKFLRILGQPAIIEFPFIDWDLTPDYMYWSTTHWSPLVNGYSGYTPPDYDETRALLRTFPDGPSIARLQAFDVRYIVVHEAFYSRDDYVDLVDRMAQRREIVATGRFYDWAGPSQIFEIRPRE
jgi:hypothetical protein